MSGARDEVLARVRRALADVAEGERPEDVVVPRAYLEHGDNGGTGRFVERVTDYGARVQIADPGSVPTAIERTCREHEIGRLVTPPGIPAAWLPAGVEAVLDTDLDVLELERVDAVLTGCAVAIAETGTIVLDGGARQGRRVLTLVPDVHVCVVEASQIVAGVPEALRQLCAGGEDALRRVTMISGPSATSDIELSRVEGVHGPRRLEVVLVGESGA